MNDKIVEFLSDAVDSISVIEETLQGVGYNDYRNDRKMKITVVDSFENLFEAVRHIPEEIRAEYSDVPWEEFENMRLDIKDENYGVDEERVWKWAKIKLRKIKKLLNQAFFT